MGNAYRAFKENFALGKTSGELFSAFEGSLKKELGEYETVYDYIWGKDTLRIDGETEKGYIPKPQDTLIMDISVGKDGVWCDVCRTFFVGEPTEGQRERYALIERSLRAGHRALRAGVSAEEIYGQVNAVYKEQGKELAHHAGHKIGEKPLLQPQFLLGNKTPLVKGGAYTVESGLYEEFGIRLENDFVITDGSAEDLFENILPLEITWYILK